MTLCYKCERRRNGCAQEFRGFNADLVLQGVRGEKEEEGGARDGAHIRERHAGAVVDRRLRVEAAGASRAGAVVAALVADGGACV